MTTGAGRRGTQYAAVLNIVDAVITRAYLANELGQPLNAFARPAATLAAMEEAIAAPRPAIRRARIRHHVAREVDIRCEACDVAVRWRRVALSTSVSKVPRYCSACRSHVTGRKVVNWEQVA